MMNKRDYDELLKAYDERLEQLQRLKKAVMWTQIASCFVIGFCIGIVIGAVLANMI